MRLTEEQKHVLAEKEEWAPETERKKQEEMAMERENSKNGRNSGKGTGEKDVRHQTAQSEMKVGLGRYMGRTCESVCKEDPNYCEGVKKMDTEKGAIIEFQEFMKMYDEEWEDERREAKRRELREREAKLEENRKTAESGMEERKLVLQQTRDMVAGMDAELKSGRAASRRDDDDEARRSNPTAVARRNDDETADGEHDTMAAARQDNDEAKENGDDMTTGGNDNTTTVGATEMSPEERWRFPFEFGREIPRDKMMTEIELNETDWWDS